MEIDNQSANIINGLAANATNLSADEEYEEYEEVESIIY
jgi:hypothetical protein